MNFLLFEKWNAMFRSIASEIGSINNGTMLPHSFFKTRMESQLAKPVKHEFLPGYVSTVRQVLETNHNKSLINVRGQGWRVASLEERKNDKKVKETRRMETNRNTFGQSAMVLGHRGKWSAEHGIFALKTIQAKGRTKEAIRIISDKVGVTESSVTQKLGEYGKASRDQRYSSMTLEEGITQYHMDGCPLAPHKTQ